MDTLNRTIIVIDDDVDFTSGEFMLAWNAQAAREKKPIAAIIKDRQTFDSHLMDQIGYVANFIQIATFIGVPTVAALVNSLRSKRHASPAAAGYQKLQQSPTQPVAATSNHTNTEAELRYDETIIDLGSDGKVNRITIRRAHLGTGVCC